MSIVLVLVVYSSVAIAIVALALAVLRRWPQALVASRVAVWLAGVLLLLALSVFAVLFAAPGVASPILHWLAPGADPADRARFLAQGIAELMNTSALSIPVLILTVPIWLLSRARVRSTASDSGES